MGILMMLHRQICDYSSLLLHTNYVQQALRFDQRWSVMVIQSSSCSVLVSHNLVIYSSVYLLHFNGSVHFNVSDKTQTK
ncbi:hypothetical protein NC653_002631 [Populus alba x Populus x berolinensis]|uniref:Uncharacterized protein n=1 Tax=Populus alba x Populus x berolinensis TaxID=444605 RepID=A0AAD6WH22_9ROSI|nr:hypothetical protein NC653_002631 [Populus alba x Populus x berolinensis]